MLEENLIIIEKMKTYGGTGFIQALADCFYNADETDFKILRKSFPEYWEQYRDLEVIESPQVIKSKV